MVVVECSCDGRSSHDRLDLGEGICVLSLTSSLCRGAVTRNMTGLAATIADLAGCIEGSAVWSCTITGYVTLERLARPAETGRELADKLAACIAFHGLSLAVSRIMIGPSTFVARCWAWATDETTSKSSTKAASTHHSTTAQANTGTWASTLHSSADTLKETPRTHCKMTRLSTGIASAAGLSATQT